VLADVLALGAQVLDGAVVALLGDVHGEVHVDAAAPARQSDLRAPQADPRAVAGHDPDRLALGPALDHRQAEDTRVEALGGFEVDDLEDELADAGHAQIHADIFARRPFTRGEARAVT
jgi:hypothetical protein